MTSRENPKWVMYIPISINNVLTEYKTEITTNIDIILHSAFESAIERELEKSDLSTSIVNNMGWTTIKRLCPTQLSRRRCRRLIAIFSIIIHEYVKLNIRKIIDVSCCVIKLDKSWRYITIHGYRN